jgi:pyruvate,water dikinase
MKIVFALDEITDDHRMQVGGKGFALARLSQAGFPVPRTLCLTTDAYHSFIKQTPLGGNIALELSRKKFDQMRWEEMWDTSLRIRNHFLHTPLPPSLESSLKAAIHDAFGAAPVAVRSSAEAEDAEGHSFAGLHDSFLNIAGTEGILEHIKKVWASLWSDAAILYRQELELDIESSGMGVVIQEFIPGEVSGVAFGKNPLNPDEMIIEAVPGLNEGLVDGKIEPDRWILDRSNGKLISTYHATRDSMLSADMTGVKMVGATSTSEQAGTNELLTEEQLGAVFKLVRDAENLFGSPQDVEWTFHRDGLQTKLHILQSRPITRKRNAADEVTGSRVRDGEVSDKRSWYLSLRPNFDKLRLLRKRIEDELIPAMIAEAEELAAVDLARLSESEIAEAVIHREKRRDYWQDIYWDVFIPFAHGVRLFGRVYNDRMQPTDPYEFVDLLRPERMESTERDQLIAELAGIIKTKPEIREAVSEGRFEKIGDETFNRLISVLRKRSGTGLFTSPESEEFGKLLVEMADVAVHRRTAQSDSGKKIEQFLSTFPDDERSYARELLDLGRSSYRLRDDDNIYLGMIEQEVERAAAENARRSGKSVPITTSASSSRKLEKAHEYRTAPAAETRTAGRERQLVGQPAGAGLVTAKARVIKEKNDLFAIKQGEVIVCDAIDPAMTFVIPLASGIVERRGGMLIHGAIIAREYGLPCVTGIPQAVDAINTGDRITVDGYLGIVVIYS